MLYRIQGKYAQALDCLRQANDISDNSQQFLMRQHQEQAIFRIQKQYDYESLQNMMNRKLVHRQRIIAIGIVLILVILALFFYHSAQRNKKEAETNASLFHFMQQNKELQQKHETSINLEGLASGNYTMRVVLKGGKAFTDKVVKE